MSRIVLVEQASSPSSPAASRVELYYKTDGLWYFKDDSGTERKFVVEDPASPLVYPTSLCPPGQGVLLNGKVETSVASNALTLSIKGADGNTPSSSNPVYVAFRSATAATGGFTVRSITSALSVVVSSGSTLGHASGKLCHLFAYCIDNSGAVELAVSNLPPDYPGTFADVRLISTTAEGGAGAADSATGIYSTTARSNVPWVCVAKMLSTQATAGTWAANMTQVDQAPFAIPRNAVSVTGSGAQTVATATAAKVTLNSETFDYDGVFDASSNYRYQPNVAGMYRVTFIANWATTLDGNAQCLYYIYKNGGIARTLQTNEYTGGQPGQCVDALILMNGTSDYVEGYVYQSGGGNEDLGSNRFFDAERVGEG